SLEVKQPRSKTFGRKTPSFLSPFPDVPGPAAVSKRCALSEMQGDVFGLRAAFMEIDRKTKMCKSCKCSQEDHCLSSDLEDDRKIGRLLMDSKYSTLTARVKGGDGIRIYKRNRMIMTNPIATGKDPTFDTITYEWAPPGVTQKLGLQYMELIPKEKQPVTGTEGAYYRRRQLLRQLPIYDQDPSRCRGLLENELKVMEEFVKQYKSEALGVGEVALPGQGGLPKEEGKQQEKPEGAETAAPTTNGSISDPSKEHVSLSHPSIHPSGLAETAQARAAGSGPQPQALFPHS
ncbi:hypothetical protein EI555_017515, partial [Monodon monoceros]